MPLSSGLELLSFFQEGAGRAGRTGDCGGLSVLPLSLGMGAGSHTVSASG